MKWLFFISIFVFSICALGTNKAYRAKLILRDTVPQGAPQLFGAKIYEFKNYVLVDSFIMNRPGDTNNIPYWPAFKFKRSDMRWYAYDSTNWKKLLYASDTANPPLDSGKYILNQSAYAQNGAFRISGTATIGDTVKTPNILTKTDTALFKPLAVDINGNHFKLAGWPLSSSANNGLSKSGDNIQFGQSVGASGNPAKLLNNRELNSEAFTVSFKDSATKNKTDIGSGTINISDTNITQPFRATDIHTSNTTAGLISNNATLKMTSSFNNSTYNNFLLNTLRHETKNGSTITTAASNRHPLFAGLMTFENDTASVNNAITITGGQGVAGMFMKFDLWPSASNQNKTISGALIGYDNTIDVRSVIGTLEEYTQFAAGDLLRQASNLFHITNMKGLRIKDMFSTGNVTNPFAIYQEGASDTNYLAGITRMPNLTSKVDTTVYKPAVVDAGGRVFKMSGWPISGISGSGTTNRVVKFTSSTTVGNSVITDDGTNIGIGSITSPTARLHLPAGTATANTAPVKYTSGPLLTTPEIGAWEFLTDKPYFTITTGTARKEFTLNDSTLVTGRLPFTTTNGRLKSSSNLTYLDAFQQLVVTDQVSATILYGSGAVTVNSGSSTIDGSININSDASNQLLFGVGASANPSPGYANNAYILYTDTKLFVDVPELNLIGSTGVYIGHRTTVPTAKLHIVGGSATAGTAPLKLTSGALLTTPESGATEFDGTHYYFTIGGARYQIDQQTSVSSSIPGTSTNNNASTGNIGEETSSTISTYTNYTTTATYQNITSITLSAGDWDVSAQGTFSSNGATITGASDAIFVVSTTTASAAGATEGKNIAYVPQAALLGTSHESITIAPFRVSLSGSTTYYLNGQATFTIGNPQFVGTIRARRVR